MALLEELHQSISTMTDEELAETFRQIRLSRRTYKPKHKTKKKTAAKPVTLPSPDSMSPEMAAQLLKSLGA